MDAIEQLKQDGREGRIDVDRLIDVIVSLQRQLEAAKQRIAEALAAFARQTGLHVVYVFEVVRDKKSNAVPAGLRAEEALARLNRCLSCNTHSTAAYLLLPIAWSR